MAKERKTRTEAQKQAEFVKRAERHGTTILMAADRLGALGNAKKYSSTPKQLEKLRTAINDALEAAFDSLEGKKTVAAKLSLS